GGARPVLSADGPHGRPPHGPGTGVRHRHHPGPRDRFLPLPEAPGSVYALLRDHAAGRRAVHPGEADEVAVGQTASTTRRNSTMTSNGDRFNVGGVLLPRPCKLRRLGHFRFTAVKLA